MHFFYQRTPFIYQLNARSLLVQILNGLLQHVSVFISFFVDLDDM